VPPTLFLEEEVIFGKLEFVVLSVTAVGIV
jgi:hypothetical protein